MTTDNMTIEGEGQELATPASDPKLEMALVDTPITYRTLQTLINTPTVPARYAQSPTGVQDMYAAVLYGREIGVAPMEAIQSLYHVNGTASMSGKLMSALIHRAGHKIKVRFTTNKVIVTCFRRDPVTLELDEVGEVDFGAADAKAAGLDEKGTYKAYPRLMWAWRAITFAGRLFYADVLSGIAYVPEELNIEDKPEPLDIDNIDVEFDGDYGAPQNAARLIEDELEAEVVVDLED